MKNERFGNSLINAFRGIATVLRDERNFTIEMIAAVVAIGACFIFHVSRAECAVVIVCCFLVLAAECLNSAVEYIIDLVSPKYHPLAKKAKDAAAGAVLVSALGSVAVGLVIFLPKLLEFLHALIS